MNGNLNDSIPCLTQLQSIQFQPEHQLVIPQPRSKRAQEDCLENIRHTQHSLRRSTTRFADGLYGPEELDSAAITEKNAKISYLEKIFNLVGICLVCVVRCEMGLKFEIGLTLYVLREKVLRSER